MIKNHSAAFPHEFGRPCSTLQSVNAFKPNDRVWKKQKPAEVCVRFHGASRLE